MHTDNSASDDLIHCLDLHLQQIIDTQNLDTERKAINAMAIRINRDVLDCAAALLFRQQSQIASPPLIVASSVPESVKARYRFVRYRLDVGSQHQVEKEQIETVLIQESGVDKKRIGKIDIRHNYTLVELPDGMPADIFQLLSEAKLGERKLAIKRVKSNRKTNKT
ncbi:DbpA RNA binding domain-containing protein [Methylomonas sp. AM2-LC]|uniref:DbpA RNA binding domain-containing protein n=1 Tax=Methylomonas sp. AM2-LC TaxID=3153301 RepID=UPI003266BF7C